MQMHRFLMVDIRENAYFQEYIRENPFNFFISFSLYGL